MQMLSKRWLLRGAGLALIAAALVLTGARPLAHAWGRWERAQWHKQLFDAYNRMQHDDGSPPLVLPERESGDDTDEDDATVRRLYTLAYYGNFATPDVSEQLLGAGAREATRWPSLMRSPGVHPNAVVAGQSWLNLGPTDARIQKNGSVYNGIDSGRAATIRVDPRSKDVVYLATAWGGVWKTYNFTATQPSWSPITDTIGSLAVGAFDLDPNNPDTLYLGLGDTLDGTLAGGAVYKSTDGGGTWTMLTARLAGTYPASAGARAESAVTIADLAVDRSDGNKLLVATDIGLFRSVDGGAHFTMLPLPDPAGTLTLEQETWTIAYLGAAGGQSAWVVSGVDACATNQAPLGFGLDEPAGATTPIACTGGTLGDIWRSSDSGATWTSLRATSKLPTAASLGSDYARMAVAAGSPANGPDATVVYAQVANIDDANSKQLAVFKSTDGGKTFTTIATSTTAVSDSNSSCANMDVAHAQAWYNLAIAVDPTNDNNVLLGGNLCGVRSTNGGTSWDNISYWLPVGVNLPYVHADWHAVTLSNVGGTLTAFAGSDGGVFSSTNVFSAASGPAVAWNYTNNRGIATHLFYGISSGDPTVGDENVVFGGLQDNGTRFRDLDPTLGKPTTFNQVIGGDGIGTALARGPANANVYWSSLPSQRMLCKTDPVTSCSQGTGWASGPNLANGTIDPEPFLMRYSVIDGDASGSLLTATTYRVYKLNFDGSVKTALTAAKASAAAAPPLGGVVRNVQASPFTHTNCGAAGGQTCRLYGIALSGGGFVVLTDIGGTITQSIAAAPLGIGAGANMHMSYTTSIAFPVLGGALLRRRRRRQGLHRRLDGAAPRRRADRRPRRHRPHLPHHRRRHHLHAVPRQRHLGSPERAGAGHRVRSERHHRQHDLRRQRSRRLPDHRHGQDLAPLRRRFPAWSASRRSASPRTRASCASAPTDAGCGRSTPTPTRPPACAATAIGIATWPSTSSISAPWPRASATHRPRPPSPITIGTSTSSGPRPTASPRTISAPSSAKFGSNP